MIMTKQCGYCHNSFITDNKARRFCNLEHYHAHQRENPNKGCFKLGNYILKCASGKGLEVGEKIERFLEVGANENGEIVVNHPDLKPDANGVGHIVFSPSQARHLAESLTKHADQIERDARVKADIERMKAAAAIPVDRSARVLTDGSPVTDDHRELLPSGQQKGYVVLSAEERSKGFVRPVRRTYRHVGPRTCGKPLHADRPDGIVCLMTPDHRGPCEEWGALSKGCGTTTTMALSLAETYARDPSFYSGTFCATCGSHFPLDQFVWNGTTEQVGS